MLTPSLGTVNSGFSHNGHGNGDIGCASTAQITSGGRTDPRRLLVELGSFYEKVVKVKADVAAILKFFLPMPQIEADHDDAPPLVPIGGIRKGGFSEAL